MRGAPRRAPRAWLVVGGVLVVGLLLVAVFPTRTYLSQRQALAATDRRLEVLTSQNRELAERVRLLNTDDEIERLAREQYSLVRPGEEAFVILPAPAPASPRARAAAHDPPGFWSRVWDDLTFWS